MEHISGGVCAAKGFQAGGIHCGIRKNRGKRDISMIVSEVPASAAAVYTSNLVKGAPIYVTQRNLAGGIAQLAVCNSGNANTCNADGEEVAWQMCELAGKAAGIDPHHVIVASTGVIGQPLSIEPIAQHMNELYAAVKGNGGVFRRGRQGLPPRRHREGVGHDSPESGDDARFPHLRRGNFPRDAPQGAV